MTEFEIHFRILEWARQIFCYGKVEWLLLDYLFHFSVLFFVFKTRQTIDKLQSIVSTDGRFRNLRDALHRCDPPCIPYLGMYLTDLSFIEEGTPDFTDDGLLNFSKMRMVCSSDSLG